jgi:hypothetical protein
MATTGTTVASAIGAVSPSVLRRRNFVESKFFCWLLENITVITLTTMRGQLPEPEVR